MKTSIPLRIFLILVAGLLPIGNPSPVSAHGSGVPKLIDVQAGPYLVNAWLSPAEPAAGEAIHVTVGVQLPGDSGYEPVLDADITLQVNAAATGELILTSKATTEQSVNKLLYESDMSLESADNFTVIILVTGAAGDGQTSFALDVKPSDSRQIRTTTIAIAFGFLLGAGLIVRWWRQRILSVNKS